MKNIEKMKDNHALINDLYKNSRVVFETTVLESDMYRYCISYFAPEEIYDVVIEDIKNNKIVNYECRRKLSNSTLKYFNLLKDDVFEDNFDNKFICISHLIEYN